MQKVYYRYDENGQFIEPVIADYHVKDDDGCDTDKVELPTGVSEVKPDYKVWNE
jgi:hypothetical protein